jgi:hypothetical protein
MSLSPTFYYVESPLSFFSLYLIPCCHTSSVPQRLPYYTSLQASYKLSIKATITQRSIAYHCIPIQSVPFSAFHRARYASPLRAPFGSPSNRPRTGFIFLVMNGVSCPPAISISTSSTSINTRYLEVFQVFWHHICSDFFPFDNVASMLRMPTRGTRTRSLIEALVRLFRSQGEP